MRGNLLRRCPKVVSLTLVMFFMGGLFVESQGKLAKDQASDKSLPKILVPVLSEVKAGSLVPVLLPNELPGPIAAARHAVVQKAEVDEYAISLYYELGIGDAGFAAFFSAQAKPKYNPRELGNIQKVELAHGLVGFFRAVSCGGSCAPANLWWQQDGALYQIQLKLSPSLSERSQEKAILAVANSAILAGPR